ncbi:type II toxin-antitoxin system PemK/MazF family toxin [Lentilactobacillus raoultii]|uniref:Type II toxin-antitoxin system PemK/MazF family toxin n=1 Tax=Lentilactobacillus raoultii TaxID=1987503 RepID=A0ABW3PLM2_9LACO|nr:type II toxin-antitoxin system PemK/MazF family toxin [Lentilactobacillus raoultii]
MSYLSISIPRKAPKPGNQGPYLVVSNDEYNRHSNTVLLIFISSSDKYKTQERFIHSPLFKSIGLEAVHDTALLQHVRTIYPKVRFIGRRSL